MALLRRGLLLLALAAATEARGVSLEFSELTCTLAKRKGKPARRLLSDVAGRATPGRLLAIMGPSGSGKTTLLNALAGQVVASPGLELSGRLVVDGAGPCQSAADGGARACAFVQQQDLFYAQMTVAETLRMAARLRLPRELPRAEKLARADEVLRKLGLAKAAGTLVGDEKGARGVSGGEKKRLAIACELIDQPELIFLDEPTSGLDAYQAEQVVQARALEPRRRRRRRLSLPTSVKEAGGFRASDRARARLARRRCAISAARAARSCA